MTHYTVPSKDEVSSGGGIDRVALPGMEDYLCTVLAADPVRKNDFNGVERDFTRIELAVNTFADGGVLEDVNGNPVDDRKIWRDIDTSRLGFRKDGTASLSRQFLVYINGISDITERVPDGDTSDLIGKTIIASLIVYTGVTDGKLRNKIVGFKPTVRTRRRPVIGEGPPPAKTDEHDDEYARAVASLVNDTDDPTADEVEQTMAALDTPKTSKK